MTVLITFLVSMTTFLTRSNMKEKVFTWSLGLSLLDQGKVWQQVVPSKAV